MNWNMERGLEVSNILIVESNNDKYFIEALINHLNLHIKIGDSICINEYECLNGISKLEKRLKNLKAKILKEDIKKIGIIFDADRVGIEKREEEVKDKIKSVFGEYDNSMFSIYILNKNGEGELEDILKEIKTDNSPYADCLDSWRKCLLSKKIEVSNKIFNKFWVNNYIMYDTCRKSRDRGEKSKYCIFEYAIKEKKIWNFDHSILNDLKEFLKQIGKNSD